MHPRCKPARLPTADVLAATDGPIPENKQETPGMPAEEESRLAMEYNEYAAKTNDSADTETV